MAAVIVSVPVLAYNMANCVLPLLLWFISSLRKEEKTNKKLKKTPI